MRTSIPHRLLKSTVRPRSTRRRGQPTGSTPTTIYDAPRQESLPARGVVFSSEVQCPLDTVTAFHSHAHPAASCGACGVSYRHSRSGRSSSRRFATVAADACTAPRRSTTNTRRWTTCIRWPREARTCPGTSLRPVRRAIASRRTCCRSSFSCGIPGQGATSSITPAPCIER